jgi:hypothetical protein
MVLTTPSPASVQVHLPPLMPPHAHVNPPLAQQRDLPVRAIRAIGEDDLIALQRPMEGMAKPGLTRLRALETPQRRAAPRPAGSRQHDHDPGNRAAHARRLAPGLCIRLLVLLGVGHGHRRTIHDLDRAAMPMPCRRPLLRQPLSASPQQPLPQRLREPLARLAVATGARRTWAHPLRHPQGIAARDRCPARGVIAVELAQEGAQRHQRGEEPLAGFDTCLAAEVDDILDHQHSAERSGALLQEPAEQALELRQGSPSDRIQPGRPPGRLRRRVHPL